MPDRLAILQKIADVALRVRTLERELIPATDALKVMRLLNRARVKLDEALADLARLERDE